MTLEYRLRLDAVRKPKIGLWTARDKIALHDALYGRWGPYPRLKQVVPGREYIRGDRSHLFCTRCGGRIGVDQDRYGRCISCAKKADSAPIQREDWQSVCKRMWNAEALTGGRW
jgi:hypothetical protein